MAYTRRPLNPLTPFVNQVVVESSKVNDNFDLLSQAFLNNDPATRVLKSDVYTFRRVNLSGATSDYDLQLGEEAYYVWDTASSTSLPLRIRVSGMLYEMIVVVSERRNTALHLTLLPNNMTYSSAFQRTVIYPNGIDASVNNMKFTLDSISYQQVGGGGTLVSWLQTTTMNKGEKHFMTLHYSGVSISYFMLGSHRWNNTITVWSSLGTLTINAPNGTIHVSIRRLL